LKRDTSPNFSFYAFTDQTDDVLKQNNEAIEPQKKRFAHNDDFEKVIDSIIFDAPSELEDVPCAERIVIPN